MNSKSFISIRNGIIATVIGGIILMAVTFLRGHVLRFFFWIWSGVEWCWNALFSPYWTFGWAFLILFIFAFVGIVNIIFYLVGKFKVPEYKKYVEDTIHGVNWHWQWDGSHIAKLRCYCPSCQGILICDDSSCNDYLLANKTVFFCEHCSKIVSTVHGYNHNNVFRAVTYEIDRRIRTEEYKKQ
ncbi:hypothetical protein ACFL6K_05670 [Candidatus Latescibacterota bacterium]